MNKKDLAALITLATVATNNADGFTVSARDYSSINEGYAVAIEATQNSFGIAGLAKVYEYCKTHSDINAIGGWLNTDNNQYYFDATVVVNDLADAIALGRMNHQIAIFDLTNCKEIRL